MLVRWTIGPVRPAGFACLEISVRKFQFLYPSAELYICYNGINATQLGQLQRLPARLVDQTLFPYRGDSPIGVAWKLRPPRLALDEYELFLDNDLVLGERINEIDQWVDTQRTLILEAEGRNYGRFERHIPSRYHINSGLFGIPPGFDLESYVALWGQWSNNCLNESRTWDEQGLVASAMTHYTNHFIISKKTVVNCWDKLVMAPGLHFVGLNRMVFHRPFAEYVSQLRPFLL